MLATACIVVALYLLVGIAFAFLLDHTVGLAQPRWRSFAIATLAWPALIFEMLTGEF